MQRTKCPTCSSAAKPSSEGNRTFPFCSERCRTIDLGNWVDERYRVAAEPATDERWPTES